MEAQIKLTDSSRTIQYNILKGCRDHLDAAIQRCVKSLRIRAGNIVVDAIFESPEVQSILDGNLRYDFGMINPQYFVSYLMDSIRKAVNIQTYPVKLVGQKLDGGLDIYIIRRNFADIYDSMGDKAVLKSHSFDIEWLRWLLEEGNNILISGWHISYSLTKAEQKLSRTGKAIMRKGGNYRIPAEFSGNPSDNFITRSLLVPPVQDLLLQAIQKSLEESI